MKQKKLSIIERAFEIKGFEDIYNLLNQDFTISGKARSTFKNYINCVAQVALFFEVSPEKLSQKQINDFLFYCKNTHASPSESFFKHVIYGLRAMYKLIDENSISIHLPIIKQNRSLPVVLNHQEVKQLIASPKCLRKRLIIACLYGCGLRSYELCNLKLAHVDFMRKCVLITKQKGKLDRYVPLGEMLSRGLQKYIQLYEPEEFLFNSGEINTEVAKPITTGAIHRIIFKSKNNVKTSKKITAHVLRHTYATHLLESGLNIIALKELLGHARIESTLIYLHVTDSGSSKKISPLDKLYSAI